jgi:outer membrane protein insertion porin family
MAMQPKLAVIGRNSSRCPLLAAVGVLLVASIVLGQAPGMPPQPAAAPIPPPAGENVAAASVEGEPIVEVRVVGNKSMPVEKITPHIRMRAGRPFSMQRLQEDARTLDNTRMFVSVRTFTQRVPGGIVVIFDVLERPMLMDVKFIGNVKFTRKALQKEAKVKVGDPVDPFAIEESRRTLEEYYHRKGYDKARITLLEGSKAEDRRAIYLINEGAKQKVMIVKTVGNSISSTSRLRTQIETSRPILYLFSGELDRKKLDEDVEKLTAYYRGLGFFRARIGREVRPYDSKEDGDAESILGNVAKELNQFETSNWVVVTFIIDEGPRYKIRNVAVKGNKKYGSQELLADSKLKGGEYFNQAKMEADKMAMLDRYGAVGYVFAKVTPDPRFLEEDATLDLIYDLEEGARYTVGKIDVVIKGEYPHTKISTVLNRLSLHPGDIVDMRELRASERRLKSSQLFNNNPGEGDVPKIEYHAPESEDGEESLAEKPKSPRGFRGQSPDGEERKVTLTLYGTATNPKAWDELPAEAPTNADRGLHWLPAQQARGASVLPAQAAGTAAPQGYAAGTPAPQGYATQQGYPVQQTAAIRPVYNPAPSTRYQEQPVVRAQYTSNSGGAAPVFTSQLPGLNGQPVRGVAPDPQYPAAAASATYPATNGGVYDNSAVAGQSTAPLPPGTAQPVYNQPVGNQPSNGYVAQPGVAQPNGNYIAPANAPPAAPYAYPYNAAGALPPPDRPVNPAFRDDSVFMSGAPEGEIPTRPLPLQPRLEETTTGRFMFGVGVNSDAGLFGSVVVDEQNFSLFRFPHRWEEVKNATAFRGNGERLRLEAQPGTQVQRYSATWQNPYIFDTQNSLGVNGFYYSRAFINWFEQRIGGGVSAGRQFTPDLSGSLGYRGASINISNPNVFDVPQINEVLGNNTLHGFSVRGAYDTRDNPFLPTEGHLIDAQVEQVIGSFVYPRAYVDIRKHFKLYERPDGSGRHVLTVSAHGDYTGPNTPIYENIFYGGFSTIRGFSYRGVSPMFVSLNPLPQNVAVGGQFGMLASAEYMFPITADDMLRGVIFCDSGTVEPTISNWSNKYRVAPGFGLRITVPAMGPAPIALDFAFPVVDNPGDVHEIFSFFVGFNR